MARRCWRMVLLAFLTHVSLELCGFVGSWTAVKAQPTTVRVHALDPDAAAALGVASSAVSIFDFVRKRMAWFEKKFTQVQPLPGLSPATKIKDHAERLLDLMRAQQIIIPLVVELPEQPIEGTGFQRLMMTVLNDNRTSGLSALHAEPGVGKSVATALALRNCTQKSAVTVLLQGKFTGILEEFFRVSSADQAPRVASELFRILNQNGIRLQIVFDNTFDTGLMGQDPLLMDLTRHAFQYCHHLIVTTQSEEAAREAATLNGERTRVVQQEDARTYRWRNTQARDFLTNNPLMDFREQTVEVVLNMTQIPDTFGGWRPVSIMEYLQTGRRPQAPQAGQGSGFEFCMAHSVVLKPNEASQHGVVRC